MFENSKNVKRIISISAAALCMISSLRVAPSSIFVTDAADTTLTAFEITEDMKIGWNLGNTLDATVSSGNTLAEHTGLNSETAWGQPKASQELFDAIKAKGFNTVRIPTTWFQHLDADNNIDAEWMARVHEVVDYAYKNDMYVILNLHPENWVNRSDLGTAYDEMKPKLLKIWQQIATEFKDYDQHLIFECMNEPRAVGTLHEWWGPEQSEVDCINNLNADFVNLIRSIDSPYKDTRLLMIPGYCASSDITMISKIAVPEDDYVAVSIHAYSPYSFAMQYADDKGNIIDHSTFSEKYQLELANILEGIRKTFIANDVPVIIGEFGTSNYGNTEARMQWADQYISTTKAYGIPCVLWDNDARDNKDAAERHDYINRRTLEWYEDSVQVVDKMMDVLADDSIAWGSKKQGTQYEHEDITTGKQLLSSPVDLDASVKDGNCTPGLNATWADLEKNDVAIKFTGDAPVIAVVDGSWQGWTEISPYDIDEKNGIAYYSGKSIGTAWTGDTSEIEHIFARTNGKTSISAFAIIGETSGDIVEPEDKTKKYPISLDGVDRTATLRLSFEGEANLDTNGCVGFSGAEDWEQVEWSGKTDADGKLVVDVPLSKVYEGAKSVEAQIWYNAEKLDMVKSEFITGSTQPTSEHGDGIWGDANMSGEVKMNDAVLIMQAVANADVYGIGGSDANALTDDGAYWADVYENNNGDITNMDAVQIQKFLIHAVTSLDPKDFAK